MARESTQPQAEQGQAAASTDHLRRRDRGRDRMMKELPFVLGVLSDLSGKPEEACHACEIGIP